MTQTKRKRRKDARPDEIIAAALREFGEKGYSATSMGSIAARADIARSTIYLYFDDKEALIRRAFEERIGKVFEEALDTTQIADRSFEAMFSDVLNGIYVRLVGTDSVLLLKVLVAEGDRFPELVKFYHSTVLRKAELLITTLLERGVETGEVREDIFDFDVKLVIAPAIVAALWHLTFHDIDPIDIPQYIKGHLSFLKDGIGAK